MNVNLQLTNTNLQLTNGIIQPIMLKFLLTNENLQLKRTDLPFTSVIYNLKL